MWKYLLIIATLGLTAPIISLGAPNLASQLAGRIVLDVENHGEAWYIDPLSLQRVYLGRPEDALRVMSEYGLGISPANLALIPMSHNSSSPTLQNVPFVAQAPLGEWSDPRQQEGCEEASVLMALAWAQGEQLTATQAKTDITAMSDWEKDHYGYFQDTSVADTASRLIDEYSHFAKYEVQSPATIDDAIAALQAGHVLLLPINGQIFQPFHYTPPGPARHMIVIRGYDATTQIFSVNDPGTSQGENLQVTKATLEASWRDYASGVQVPIPEMPKAMIIIKK